LSLRDSKEGEKVVGPKNYSLDPRKFRFAKRTSQFPRTSGKQVGRPGFVGRLAAEGEGADLDRKRVPRVEDEGKGVRDGG